MSQIEEQLSIRLFYDSLMQLWQLWHNQGSL